MKPDLLATLLAPGGLSVVFQPICEVDASERRLFALECLTRGPAGTHLASADVLFEYVRRKAHEAPVDRLCVANALREAASLELRLPLCINVHATTLARDADFTGFVEASAASSGCEPRNLIFALVEGEARVDDTSLFQALEALRSLGARLAVDANTATGGRLAQLLIEGRPDFLEIDPLVVRDCQDDPRRQALLRGFVELADRLGARLVARGVETPGEMDTLVRLGIDLMQGHLLAPPLPTEQTLDRLERQGSHGEHP